MKQVPPSSNPTLDSGRSESTPQKGLTLKTIENKYETFL